MIDYKCKEKIECIMCTLNKTQRKTESTLHLPKQYTMLGGKLKV